MFRITLLAMIIIFGLAISAWAETYSSDPVAELKQARTYQKQGFYEQAEAICHEVLKNYPDTNFARQAQKRLVILHILEGESTKVQEAFGKLITDFTGAPNLQNALCRVARRYEMLGKYDKASGVYQQLIQLYPDSSYADKARLGIAKSQILSYGNAGDHGRALAAIDTLTIDFSGHPDLPEALYHIAKGYKGVDKYGKADDLYQYIMEQYPDSLYGPKTRLHVEKNEIRFSIDAGDYNQAQEATEKLAADFYADSSLPAKLYRIARRYEAQGKHEKAKSIYQQIIQQHPDSVYVGRALLDIPKSEILCFIDDANDTAAQEALDSFIADFNSHPYLSNAVFRIAEQYYNKARLNQNEGIAVEAEAYYQKAIAVLKRVITEFPVSGIIPRVYCSLALTYHDLAQYEKAIEYCKRAVANWPHYEFAWYAQFMIADCYEKLERSGRISTADAAAKIHQACEKLLTDYPEAKAVTAVHNLLERWDLSKN